jgi:hypothetical protein
VLRNRAGKIGLVKLRIDGGKEVFAFLSLSCGVLAEIDIKSEFMRALGEIRYDLYAIWVMIKNTNFQYFFNFLCYTLENFFIYYYSGHVTHNLH